MKPDPHVEHLKYAAKKGDVRSQYELALKLAQRGEADDNAQAKAWLLRAAEAGLRDAQLLLQLDTLGLNAIEPAQLGEIEPTKPIPAPAPDLQPPAPPPKREARPAPPWASGNAKRPSTGSAFHDEAQRRIDGIEAEMRNLGCWTDEPAPPEKLDFSDAFAMDRMAFTQWLNWIFVPRVREIIAQRGQFPSRSMVAAQAVREFDGWNESSQLLTLLAAFDDFIERGKGES
ncbi:MAG: YqcC family protein [Phycisphaeraceae bacterium]